MSLPKIVSQDEWMEARKAFLAKEKEATKERDALNTERRELPMVEIEKDCEFDGPEGKADEIRVVGVIRSAMSPISRISS